MLTTVTSQKFILRSDALIPSRNEKIESAKFPFNGKTEAFDFDGRVEGPIVESLLDKDKAILSFDQLGPICQQAGPDLENARRLLASGAETVKVPFGTATWTAKQDDKGALVLSNGGGLYDNEQTLRFKDEYVNLTTRAAFVHNNDTVKQTIVGSYNGQTGTITCLQEQIEITSAKTGYDQAF